MMKSLPLSLAALGLASLTVAQAPTVKISIGVRETGANGAIFTNIGDNGTAGGGIEWVNKDAQTLTLDGTWQQFTFDFATDPITAFAGSTANGVIDGLFGTLEHIRVLNDTGYTGPVTIWIDSKNRA